MTSVSDVSITFIRNASIKKKHQLFVKIAKFKLIVKFLFFNYFIIFNVFVLFLFQKS